MKVYFLLKFAEFVKLASHFVEPEEDYGEYLKYLKINFFIS